MSNPYFRFKQFTIWHDKCAMRVNTDGVLLGAWTNIEKPSLILDIGAGTGLIALMMAQRSSALIHAVEIEENAFKQARFNAEKSPWPKRVEVLHDDFLNYAETCAHEYDLIVSNPPYFSNSLKNPNPSKTLARHNHSLPFNSFLKGVSHILRDGGTFSVILPENTSDFENEAFINGLKCTRELLVYSSPGKKVIRKLLEFRKTENLLPVTSGILNIHDDTGNYSNYYKEITRDFYLNF